MVIIPMLSGLFGLNWDAPNHTIRLAPHLPADWDHAHLHNVPLGSATLDMDYQRSGGSLLVTAKTSRPEVLCLVAQTSPATPCKSAAAAQHTFTIPLPAVELSIPANLPGEGSATAQIKTLNEDFSSNRAVFSFEALGGSSYELPLRLNHPNISVQGADIRGSKLHLQFPQGAGYQTKTVTFVW